MSNLQRFYIRKLDALRRLWVMLAFDKERPPTLEPLLLALLCYRLCDSHALPVQREAVGFLLDIYLPGWREKVSLEVLGYVINRSDPKVREWRAAVIKRDDARCVKCGSLDDPHAHHVLRWIDAPTLRLIVDNGVTLCGPCHRAHHAGGRA